MDEVLQIKGLGDSTSACFQKPYPSSPFTEYAE